IVNRTLYERDIDLAVDDATFDCRCVSDAHLQVDLRRLLKHFGKMWRQPVAGNRCARADRQAPSPSTHSQANFFDRCSLEGEDAAGVFEHRFSTLGKADVALSFPWALKKRQSELSLKFT